MIKEKDWAGIKFKIMQEMGECIDIIYIKEDLLTGESKTFLTPHSKVDGMTGLANILEQEEGLQRIELPIIKAGKRPHLLKRFKLAIDHIKRQAPIDYAWKNFNQDKLGSSKGIAFTHFTKEESDLLESCAKENQTNVNAILIWALDKVSQKKYLDKQEKRVWMVPVNMRMPGKEYERIGNSVTTLSIHMNDETPQSVYGQIKSMMKSKIYWGGWIVANAPKYIGEKRLRKISQNLKSPYMGVCSNLGKWPFGDTGNDRVQWYLSAPVTKFCPISTVILNWKGRLGFTCQLHPSISDDLQDARDLISEWKNEVLSLFGIDAQPHLHSIDWKAVKESSLHF